MMKGAHVPLSTAPRARWLVLALLAATQFMVVLDVAIVNVALPSIQESLQFSEEDLQWVVSAYTLTFGGLLLLGGRAADLLGRRRLFLIGLAVFSLASLAAGLAQSSEVLLAARAIQGIGAAIISPAALAILVTTFEEGAERNVALGIWGAIAGFGGASGVLLGGILTDLAGWEWIFLLNVPIGAAVMAFGTRLLAESRAPGERSGFDVLGAVTVTAALTLVVYGLVETTSQSWLSTTVAGSLGAGALLLAAFVAIELTARRPLLPMRIFRLRSVSAANVVGLLLGASIFGMFFLLSLYMQQVLGYSALRAGVAYLAVALTIVVAAAVSQALVTRLGVRNVLATGMVLVAVGLLWFTQIDADGAYLVDLLPGFIIAGAGLGFSFVPVTIAALVGVEDRDAGVASGLINTTQQVGGALGVAIASTISITRAEDFLAARGGDPALLPQALTDGFSVAFAAGAGVALLGLLATLAFIPPARPAEVEPPLAAEDAPVLALDEAA
jgi:EmrB/QacA subfamily drug resistance transporter